MINMANVLKIIAVDKNNPFSVLTIAPVKY